MYGKKELLIPITSRFEPARGWLGQELTEKVEGWPTKVREASINGNLVKLLAGRCICLQLGQRVP